MQKKKIFLILSPIRITYPENYEGTIVFLGNKDYEYIKKKNPKAVIEKIENIWTEKSKLISDNKYLSNLENFFYKGLGTSINQINGTKLNNKYWSIFLRPTVFAILTALYERWLLVEHVIKNYEIENCIFLNFRIEDFISSDSEGFYKQIYYDDNFNQIIFQDILERNYFKFKKIEHDFIKFKKKKKQKINLTNILRKIKVSNFLYLFFLICGQIKNFLLLLLTKKKKFTYITHHIDDINLRKELNMFFKQKNLIFKIKNCEDENPLNLNLRKNLKNSLILETKNNFEDFFLNYIFRIIPKCFVENFKTIQKENLSSIKDFKFNLGIIKYTQLFGNEFCELDWIAKNYMNGSKLLVAQTGGGEISAEYSTIKSIMQNFKFKKLFFGIEDSIKNNTYGVGIYRFNKQKNFFNKHGKIIYAMYTPYGYGGITRTNQPIGSEWVNYMKTQEEFLNLLDPEIQKEIILRPKRRYKDYFNFQDRLKRKFPNIPLEQHGSRTLKDVLVNARLLITTLDTTTILEGLAFNFPTILICNLEKLTIATEFEPYYKILREAKIIFYSPEAAKNHLQEIFHDVESWWKKKEVQEAREIFCKKFAYHPENQATYFVKKLSEIKLSEVI